MYLASPYPPSIFETLVCPPNFFLRNHFTIIFLQPFHMIAASLNAFYNVYLDQQLPPEDVFTITVNNHPLPRNIDARVGFPGTDSICERGEFCSTLSVCDHVYKNLTNFWCFFYRSRAHRQAVLDL